MAGRTPAFPAQRVLGARRLARTAAEKCPARQRREQASLQKTYPFKEGAIHKL